MEETRYEAVWVDDLDEDVCWSLLGLRPVGRVAFGSDSDLVVLPVNHLMDGHAIVFRTGATELLEQLGGGAKVAFEVDDVDSTVETGWSVLVRGECSEVVEPAEIERFATLGLRQWAPGARTHWLRITPKRVSGRAISREGAPPVTTG